jgi:hypothetical protein
MLTLHYWIVPSSPRLLRFFPITRTFLATETCILDRHAEEHVFVLLVIGSKSILVKQHELCVIRTRFREVGKLLPDGSDQAGLSLHPFVIGHHAKRIADTESEQLPQVLAVGMKCPHEIFPLFT